MNEFQISGMEKGSSSSSSAAVGGRSDLLNGLKFGNKIYLEGVGSGLMQSKNGSAALLPSPAKKGRTGLMQGGQPPRCQVEGCKVDLSDAKAYYFRHKVCGVHSKSPRVIVAGLEQRFCQQCSRFHQLPEFDQGKRSCRRRLAGHNERRRKPPTGSLLSPRNGTFCPSMFGQTSLGNHSKTGGFVMDFSAHPILTGKDSWPNTSSEGGLGNQAAVTGNYQIPWQSNSQNALSNLLQGTPPRPSYSGPGVSSEECFNGVSDSSNALSLLSNHFLAPRTQSLSLGMNNLLGTNGTAMVQPSVNPCATIGEFGCLSWGFKGNQAASTPHEMPPDLGLGQTSHPTNSQYAGELALAQLNEGQLHELDHSRGYDTSPQHMRWSL